MSKRRKLIWDKYAAAQFAAAINHIMLDSVANAEKVHTAFSEKIGELLSRPEQHPADKNKKQNDGTYRVFELHHYRISYYVTDNAITITRVRHKHETSRLLVPFPVTISFGHTSVSLHEVTEFAGIFIAFRYMLYLKRKQGDSIASENRFTGAGLARSLARQPTFATHKDAVCNRQHQ